MVFVTSTIVTIWIPRMNYSMETSFLKVIPDILLADIGMILHTDSRFGLLDMSSAFDTVDHEIVICRFGSSFLPGFEPPRS